MSDCQNKLLVGALEYCDLPQLHISSLSARIDTGAENSSLQVEGIEREVRNGEDWISFEIHPDIHNVKRSVRRSARLKDERIFEVSNTEHHTHYVIETTLCLGARHWLIELALVDHSNMLHTMILGCDAMKGRVIVDPGEEYLQQRKESHHGMNEL